MDNSDSMSSDSVYPDAESIELDDPGSSSESVKFDDSDPHSDAKILFFVTTTLKHGTLIESSRHCLEAHLPNQIRVAEFQAKVCSYHHHGHLQNLLFQL